MIGEPAKMFEDVVAEIFRLEGFKVDQHQKSGRNHYDLVLTNSKNKMAVVEIKLFRSRSIPESTFLNALEQIERYRASFSESKAILVISAELDLAQMQIARNRHPNILVYGYGLLHNLASKNVETLKKLEDIIRSVTLTTQRREDVFIAPADIDLRPENSSVRAPLSEPPSRGAELCARIRAIAPGREGAEEFEISITEALKYVFEKDLVNWSEQHGTHDGLSRYDLISKVSSDHDFWNFVATAFRSKYIIFEFKNYTDQIKQGQIYTTEKYLYTAAMRSTAFIVSPRGFSENASKAARGALRESGKLIIDLKVEDICYMLLQRDAIEDHNSRLVDVVDAILMGFER